MSKTHRTPPGTMLPAGELAARLEGMDAAEPREGPVMTWRERLWVVPPETRIGRDELLEAVSRQPSWLYRHTGSKAKCSRIPCRKLDGELVFLVGEVRTWLLAHEEMVVPARTEPLVVPIRRKA
ncbi:MAG: hypothetical protein O7I93_16095 [Gemmatimonadetes bacterium]|nr:hypothetical protein [Gemmatimonadota bacterium]